jgi:hypothetical protein
MSPVRRPSAWRWPRAVAVDTEVDTALVANPCVDNGNDEIQAVVTWR